MHGNKSQNQRERALAAFASGRVDALVATDVAARGIDVRDVARVVNFDAPGDDKAFVHRVGRTARAGKRGVSVTFVAPHERAEVGKMCARLRLDAEFAVEHGKTRASAPSGARPASREGARPAGSRSARPHAGAKRPQSARPGSSRGNRTRAQRSP
jgi:superfamily II DNA/RNA helicase